MGTEPSPRQRLHVVAKYVVQSCDGCCGMDTGVGSVVVVVMEPAVHVGGPVVGGGVGSGVEPLAQGGLDEAFGLAVGSSRPSCLHHR